MSAAGPDGAGHPLFPILPHRLSERLPEALADAQLQAFVGGTTRLKDAQRAQVAADTFGAGHGAVRRAAGQLARHTLDHLDRYLARWIDEARARGTRVHVADTDEDARRIVVEIATQARATRCVKAKSMATEEVRLNDALEAAGVETVETDLGEYILQLDGDAPSHIVTPMIHKDRAAVGRAFERELGVPYSDDREALAAIARAELRAAFGRADLGITGGNFLVASTGAVVIGTNEGNGRMTATAPRTRVALVGIDKIIPDMEALSLMLGLLARTSTGQPLTVYSSIASGPRRPGEADGAEALHVVLLDNGRSRALADPELRDALRCIRCGACLNACPVYRRAGGHAYGSVYPGPIGAVLTPLLAGQGAYPDLPHATSLCGACHRVCPVDIDLPALLIAHRRRQVSQRRIAWRERLVHHLWAWSLRLGWAYRLSLRLQRWLLRRRAGAGGFIERAPGPARRWTETRALPAPAPAPFRSWWRRWGRRGAAGWRDGAGGRDG